MKFSAKEEKSPSVIGGKRPSRREILRRGLALLGAPLFIGAGASGLARAAEGPDGAGAAGKSEPGRVVLACTGDVTLGYHFDEYAAELEKKFGLPREEVYAYPFREVQSIFEKADLVLANGESQFTTAVKPIEKNFTFKAAPDLARCLSAGGVDMVDLANNHAMDYGAAGLADTLRALDAAGVLYFGAGMNLREARRPLSVRIKGLRIAFLGYLWLPAPHVEPDAILARPDRPGVAGVIGEAADLLKWVVEDIGKIREEDPATLVVVSFHWGLEGWNRPLPEQRFLAHGAVDAGADLVVGHHPHVLQSVETYRGVPIFYSLGNFVFGGNWNPRVKESAVALATLTASGPTGYELAPVLIDRMPERPFLPHPLEGEERRRVLDLIDSYSRPEEEAPADTAGGPPPLTSATPAPSASPGPPPRPAPGAGSRESSAE